MKSKKIISLILLGVSLISVVNPVIVYAENKTTQQVTTMSTDEASATELATEYSNNTKIALSQIDLLLQIAEKNPNQQTVEGVIKAFTDIKLSIEDIQAHEYKLTIEDTDTFDKTFLRIIEVIKKLPNDVRNKEFIAFDKKLYDSWWATFEEGFNSFYYEYIWYLKTNLAIPEIQEDLDNIVIDMLNNPNAPKPGTGDIELPPDDGKLPNLPELPKVPDEPIIPIVVPFDDLSSSTDYVKEGNAVYIITKYFDSTGKLVKATREQASKEDYILAGVYDYVDFGGGSSSIANTSGESASNFFSYINENQNPESNLTVQYTINKDGETPYYYDTGIRTSLNGKISFEQLRDVLYQVAIKSGGCFTEDTDKLLSVVEGVPILTKNTKTVYTKEDINLLFKNSKRVDVTVMETRIGKSQNLEEKIITKQANKINIDNKEIELVIAPIVKEQRALLPIQQIANELGATLTIVGNKYIIAKDDTVIVYELNKNYVLINGRATVMGTTPELKGAYLMVEVQEMAKALGYEMLWDGETGTILLNTLKK